MLFRQRQPAGWQDRIRTALWPRRSFSRSARYFAKRVLCVKASPHAVAGGVAMGVFAGFLPFFGFQFLIAALLAWLTRTSILASLLGTAVSNPLTLPLILVGTLQLGQNILGEREFSPDVGEITRDLMTLDASGLWEPLLKPMLVGAVPLGLGFAALFYVATRWMISVFHRRRRRRLVERARRRARAEGAMVES